MAYAIQKTVNAREVARAKQKYAVAVAQIKTAHEVVREVVDKALSDPETLSPDEAAKNFRTAKLVLDQASATLMRMGLQNSSFLNNVAAIETAINLSEQGLASKSANNRSSLLVSSASQLADGAVHNYAIRVLVINPGKTAVVVGTAVAATSGLLFLTHRTIQARRAQQAKQQPHRSTRRQIPLS